MKFAASYFGSRIVTHVQKDMQRLRQEGFDIVVHTFSENDFEFYERTMREIVSVSKDAGLEVWLDPWGVGGVFGGEAYSRKALTEPEWLQVSATHKRLPACCPNNPGFRRFIADWISSACATEADAVFWDEPHFFAGETGCYCRYCESAADRIPGDAVPVADFLQWTFALVRERKKQSVLCLLPDHLAEYSAARIQSLAEAGIFNLGTDPFWFLSGEQWSECIARYGSLVASTARRLGTRSHIWIQGFRVPSGREWEITEAVVAAAQMNPDVLAIWSFDGSAAMSAIACDRPEVAWQSFLEGMTKVRRKS